MRKSFLNPRMGRRLAVLLGCAVLSVVIVGIASASDAPTDLTVQWGNSGDIPLVGDVDGDGRSDFAQFEPTHGGDWGILLSTNGYSNVSPNYMTVASWGGSGDTPFLADVDGDGKADIIYYHPRTAANGGSQFHILLSSDSYSTSTPMTITWGIAGYTPLVADVDGDGKADFISISPDDDSSHNSRWAALLSSNGYDGTHFAVLGPFGHNGDSYLAAPSAASSKADFFDYNPSNYNWTISQSTMGEPWVRDYGPPTGDDYGYAPDIVKDGGTYYMFFCSNPTSTNRDYANPSSSLSTDAVRVSSSTDLVNWSTPTILLQPHADVNGSGLYQNYAYCDPSVVKWTDGYYYLYNTNTFYGYYNNSSDYAFQSYVTVSRSTSITGPYLTWKGGSTWNNTNGTAGAAAVVMPKTTITSGGTTTQGYGAGEQSVVVKDGKLWMFYVDDSTSSNRPTTDFCDVWMMQSTDPVSWNTSTATDTHVCAHSPSVKWDSSRSQFDMVWAPSASGDNLGNQGDADVRVRYSSDGTTWSSPQTVISASAFPVWGHNAGIEGDNQGWLVTGEVPYLAFGASNYMSTDPGSFVGFPWSIYGGRVDFASGSPPAAQLTVQWGNSTGTPLVGDIDGDGLSDLVFFNPTDHSWGVAQSHLGYSNTPPYKVAYFGASGDIPLLGHVHATADGKDDLITYRPSDFTWRVSYNGSAFP